MSLRNNLQRELGIPIRVRAGAPGSLNVLVDGQNIYSLKQAGRLPDSAEIVQVIRERIPK